MNIKKETDIKIYHVTTKEEDSFAKQIIFNIEMSAKCQNKCFVLFRVNRNNQ